MEAFTSVKNGKISELIVQQIRNVILDGTMKPGDRLPPIRKLAEHFKASHIPVREALKNLEASGLLTIKPGAGVFVSAVNSRPMSESLYSILRIQKISVSEPTEARILFEPSIARLACDRFTPEDAIKLEQNIQEASKLVPRM